MLKIVPLREKKILDELNMQSGYDAGYAYCLYHDDLISGYILYNLTSDCCEIIYIMAEDEAYADGLVRSVLSNMCNFNIDKAIFGQDVDKSMLVSMGIIKSVDSDIDSINSLFDGSAKCNKCNSCSRCKLAY